MTNYSTPLSDAAELQCIATGSHAPAVDRSRSLERTVAEARAALALIVTHASDPHDGFTYSEIADYASKAIARLDGSK